MNRPGKFPPRVTSQPGWSARESWRMFAIMSEFVEATERMNDILPRRREGTAVLLDSPCKEIYA